MPGVELQQGLLDDDSILVAEKELRETPERAAEALAELRRLLKEDEEIHFDDSEEFLIMFLRPTKFYPESAYKLLRRLAQFRKDHAKVLAGISPEAEKEFFLSTKVVNVLVDRDQHKRRILTMNLGEPWNPSELNTDHLFRILYLIHFGAIMEPLTQVHGAIIIMDFTGLGYKQLKAFNPQFANRLLTFIQEAMPVRLKAVHIVFQPMIFKMAWQLFKPFIKSKLNGRVFFHGNNKQSLHEHINPACLPEVYGGNRGKIDYSSSEWYPILAVHEEKIKEWQSYGFVKP